MKPTIRHHLPGLMLAATAGCLAAAGTVGAVLGIHAIGQLAASTTDAARPDLVANLASTVTGAAAFVGVLRWAARREAASEQLEQTDGTCRHCSGHGENELQNGVVLTCTRCSGTGKVT